jgi:hypothetical protein
MVDAELEEMVRELTPPGHIHIGFSGGRAVYVVEDGPKFIPMECKLVTLSPEWERGETFRHNLGALVGHDAFTAREDIDFGSEEWFGEEWDQWEEICRRD